MENTRRAAKAAGIFYIAAIVAGIIGMAIESPVFDSEDYLASAAADSLPLLLSGLFIMLMAVSVAGIGFAVYPVLKRRSEAIAVSYLGARIVESVLHLIGAIGILLIVTLAKDAIGTADPSAQTTSHLLLAVREWAYVAMDVAVFPLGAILFYSLMHRAGLVPKFLTIWGIAAVVPYFAAGVMTMFGVLESTSSYVVYFNAPLALQELALAVYLISRGFKTAK